MLSAYKLRRVKLDDANARYLMDKLSAERAKLRAAFVSAREANDHARAHELARQIRAISDEYETAADRRRAARRVLIDHHKAERRT